ncbi:MAG: GNAT family N-acetyltransferase [Pseudomonadota bacterium]
MSIVFDIGFEEPGNSDWIRNELTQSWGSPFIVIDGEVIDSLKQRCLVARPQSGLLVFRERPDDGIEVIALEAFAPGIGIGRALLDYLVESSGRQDKKYVSATTTNDNLDAIRFYQRYGFRLYQLRVGAVDHARAKLKPEIPTTGNDGIRIRDEIELRYTL